ncbi:MAG TPA: peptidase C39 family protein [Roseiflexaceae bacterium]|nr:peptidase C39 family protein [Roseiflexaceae bacterium]
MPHRLIRCLLVLLVSALLAPVASAQPAAPAYRTGFAHWRAADGGFDRWRLSGTARAADGTLWLDHAGAAAGSDPYPAGGYEGRSYYSGGDFRVGEALGPVTPTGFAAAEAIASWNAVTPSGTWLETLIRARVGARWTTWYSLGVWASDSSTVERHSVGGQADADGTVRVDTLVLGKKARADALQLKLRLFSASDAVPVVRNIGLAFSTTPARPARLAPGDPARWNRSLDVPECSQMVYPDGGEVWCSPTATSMTLGYWAGDGEACAPRVAAAVQGVYDWRYGGHGNWPFNVAYAAAAQREGYVVRFSSLAQVEPWVAAGVPVVISYAWRRGTLAGAPAGSSAGHLAVLTGFDAKGNPLVNDPAAADDHSVQRVYNRAQLERLWLEHSGGTVYLIFPNDAEVPAL